MKQRRPIVIDVLAQTNAKIQSIDRSQEISARQRRSLRFSRNYGLSRKPRQGRSRAAIARDEQVNFKVPRGTKARVSALAMALDISMVEVFERALALLVGAIKYFLQNRAPTAGKTGARRRSAAPAAALSR